MGEEWVYVKVRLRRGEYEALKARAQALGYPSVSEYLSHLAVEVLRGAGAQAAPPQIDVKRLSDEVALRLERRIVDLINPFTAKIDEMNRRLAEIMEMLEERKAESIEVEETEKPERRVLPRPPRPEARERGADALSRLREEGVLFSEEATWIKSPERFFRYLEKRGAVVLDLDGEKVAVDPGLWEKFREFVESLEVSDSEEAARIVGEELGDKAARLFKKLVSTGMLTFDEDRRTWTILLPP
ncbi:MAG: hypothetical protein F7B17_06530 [Desulfurococcales archaeon]|nr:hypothetical protein [Desulfurococcales archaeon]